MKLNTNVVYYIIDWPVCFLF